MEGVMEERKKRDERKLMEWKMDHATWKDGSFQDEW